MSVVSYANADLYAEFSLLRDQERARQLETSLVQRTRRMDVVFVFTGEPVSLFCFPCRAVSPIFLAPK